MEANEVMIGDWVLINGTPRKVQAVDVVDNEIMADDLLYAISEDRYQSEDKVEGVRITPEILEKNGFKFDKFDAEFYIGDWKLISDCCHFGARSERGWCINTKCRYVHELQHALRLLRIDKDIVL